MPNHSDDMNDVLIEALTTSGHYVVGLANGSYLEFNRADMDGTKFIHVYTDDTNKNISLAPWVRRTLSRNGVVIRLESIQWAAEVGDNDSDAGP